MKGQGVRLLDVWVLGPMMIAGGVILAQQATDTRRLLGWGLMATGAGTIVYNGANYLELRARARAARPSAPVVPIRGT